MTYGAGRASRGGWGGGGVTTANGGIEGRWGARSPSVYPRPLTFLSQRSLACELVLYLVLVGRSHASATRQRRRECEWGR